MIKESNGNMGLSWDEQIIPGTNIGDLDFASVNKFVDACGRYQRYSISDKMTYEDLLRKLALIKNGVLTRAAVLLFGKNPEVRLALLHGSN